MRSAKQEEAHLLELVRGWAQVHAWLTYHTADSRGSEAGFPDLVLVRFPDVMYVELKAHAGVATRAQMHWLDALRACGADARLVHYDSFEMRRLFKDLEAPRAWRVARGARW